MKRDGFSVPKSERRDFWLQGVKDSSPNKRRSGTFPPEGHILLISITRGTETIDV